MNSKYQGLEACLRDRNNVTGAMCIQDSVRTWSRERWGEISLGLKITGKHLDFIPTSETIGLKQSETNLLLSIKDPFGCDMPDGSPETRVRK